MISQAKLSASFWAVIDRLLALGKLTDAQRGEALNSMFIAGGAVTSVLAGERVKDYDIFFRSEESFMNFVNRVLRNYIAREVKDFKSLKIKASEAGEEVLGVLELIVRPEPKVYLAGGMEVNSVNRMDETTLWRTYATNWFKNVKIKTLDPGRRLPFHLGEATMERSTAIVQGDLDDIHQADALLVNLINTGGSRCWGTMAEVGYAYGLENIPYIVVMMKQGDRHPFIDVMADDIVETLDEALRLVKGYLNDETN